MNYVLLVLAAVAAAWWFKRRHTEFHKNMNTAGEIPAVVPLIKEKTAEEKLADSLNAARQAIREKNEGEMKEKQEQLRDMNQRLREAKNLSDKMGLSDAIIYMAETMRHWHSWSKNPKNKTTYVDGIEGFAYLSGSKVKNQHNHETTTNEFQFNGQRFTLSVDNERYSYDAENKYAELILQHHNGGELETVFLAEAVQDGSEFAPWKIMNVTTIEIGDWIQSLTVLHELFLVQEKQRRLNSEIHYLSPKAKNLKSM